MAFIHRKRITRIGCSLLIQTQSAQPTNQSRDPLYRFDLMMRWRGYLIVPVESEAQFHCSIINPFGTEISHSVSPAASPEYLWAEGRRAIDLDIRLTIQDCPELIPSLQQAGAI